MLLVTIFGGIFNQALAVQFQAAISPSSNLGQVVFTGDRILTLKYPAGSPIAQQLNGKKDSISFTENSTNPGSGINEILNSINSVLLSEKKSLVKFENATVNYRAAINGGPTQATVSYQVTLKPYMTNLVTSKNGTETSLVDLDWRSFSVSQPLYVNTQKYGKIDINRPIGGLEKLVPSLAPKLASSSLTSTLNQPILDFSDFSASMENWHFLFDATGAQAGAAGLGFSVAKGGSKIVSIYSLGESSFREGTHTAKESDTSATIDNTQVGLHSLTAPPSGQIQIGGFSKIQKIGDSDHAFVSATAPQGVETSSGSFPIQVLLIFGGMMAGIAALVLVKARK